MDIQRGYVFRLYPTPEQERAFERHFGCVRYVWNYFLEQRQRHYQATGKGLSYHDMAERLTQLKRESGHDWLREANSQALQQKLMDLDQAYQNFFTYQAKNRRKSVCRSSSPSAVISRCGCRNSFASKSINSSFPR